MTSRFMILRFLRGPLAVTKLSRSLVIGCSVLALAGCGPDDIGSPGGGNITIGDIDNSTNNPPAAPTPTPTGATGVSPATGCPTIGTGNPLTDSGTITGPEGTWRVCTLPDVISADATLPRVDGLLYAMNGRVDVGTDDGPSADASDSISGNRVTLTIQPGVILYGATGRSYMVVQRGSQINAVGNATTPIIFTSRDNVLGLVNNTSSQQWGGLVLLGRAPVSDCDPGATTTTFPVPAANALACSQELEGALNPPSFGGNTPGDSSGSLAYVQLRYSGFTLNSGSELQSLTTGGVGNGTRISYIQSHNSSDDGVELFGGEPKLDHFIVVGAEDDSFDIDTGAKADIQYGLVVQRPGSGDNALELDSPDSDFTFNALPRTYAKFTNFTFIAQGSGSQAIRVRGKADLNMSNGIVVKDGNCFRIDEEGTAGSNGLDEAGPPVFNSVLFSCTTSGDLPTYFGTGNQENYSANLTNLFVNTAAEDGYTPIFNATTVSSFFDSPQPQYVGAVRSDATWFRGWTCDSATANFGTGRSCTSLPVFN